MRIPQTFIDQVLDQTDLVALIGARVQLRKTGQDYLGLCPFHAEKTPSFTVSPAKRFYYCFGCRASGTAFDFLMKTAGMEFLDAVEELASRANLQLPAGGAAAGPGREHSDVLYALMEQAADYYHHQLFKGSGPGPEQARKYLQERGIPMEVARQYRLGYAPGTGRALLQQLDSTEPRLLELGLISRRGGVQDWFRDRLIIPICEWRRGRVAAFGARLLGEGHGPKYLNSPQTPIFHKGQEIYGLHRVLNQGTSPQQAYLVEGYMDVLGLAAAGVHNAVATLGTAITPQQLRILLRRFKQLVLCLDGDSAGRKAAVAAMQTALPLLRPDVEMEFLLLPAGEDPDSFIRREGAAAFAAPRLRVGLPEFLLRQAMAGLDTATLEGRNAMLHRAARGLQQLGDPMLRHLIVAELARRINTDADRLEEQLTQLTPLTPARPRRTGLRAPTLLGNTISLLLQQPAVALQVKAAAELATLQIPGVEVLQRMVELVHATPKLDCASLLERFRDTPWELRLRELAATCLPHSKQTDLTLEFRDALARLQQRHLRQRSRSLKMNATLSTDEQAELRTLEAQLAGVEEPAGVLVEPLQQ